LQGLDYLHPRVAQRREPVRRLIAESVVGQVGQLSDEVRMLAADIDDRQSGRFLIFFAHESER
jgi:hypothetical protein